MASSGGKDQSAAVDYEISAEPAACNVSLEYNGVTIADSDRAIRYREAKMPPVFYFPRADVRMDLMRRTRQRTHCPFKGNASYWSLTVGDKEVEDAIWSYENPLPEANAIKGFLAFHMSKLDGAYNEDGKYAEAEPTGADRANAFRDWLIRDAWSAANPSDLTENLAGMMKADGVPVCRLSVFIRTLHPLLIGSAYVWRKDKPGVNSFVLTHDTLSSPVFLDSPLIPIFNGAGGIRRHLDGANPILDFGILKQLHEEGMTDYAAMPILFSDGQINVLTISTDEPGGFSTGDLGRLHEILPALGRYFEVHAARSMANSLLQTYLGRHTGAKVLKGLIKRGDAEELHAVIWFCDLRQSTNLAESMPAEEFLVILNTFFECMVKPVVEHGGEVLNFIGDAVLAIFPLLDGDSHHQRACEDALSAAASAEERMQKFNEKRVAENLEPLDYGIGLHLGRLTYGNIGIPERLEFTVIGKAANKAARIEALTKDVDHTILASAEFAERSSARMAPVGEFELRGVPGSHLIFKPEVELGF